jgi:hypothetical protein
MLLLPVVLIILLPSVVPYLVLGRKPVILRELMRPVDIVLDDHQLYITDEMSVYIYSLKDFKLKKKFGSAGEGPGEFKNFIYVIPQDDQLLVNSIGKVSFFTKDGDFIKEFRAGANLGGDFFFPLKEGFVGRDTVAENQTLYITINLYDSKFKKVKELYRVKRRQMTEKMQLLSQAIQYAAYGNKIYAAVKKGFIIDVLDHNGKFLFSLHQEYHKQSFTSEDERKIRKMYRLVYKERYELIEHRFVFPEYYPEIQKFIIEDNRIYVYTYRIENARLEFFIFDVLGKLLKKQWVPMAFETPVLPYPFYIKNGKLFQLSENEEEEWELQVIDLYE